MKLNFKEWANFGFYRDDRKQLSDSSVDPVKRLSLEEMVRYLSSHKLGSKRPYSRWINEVQWGENVGAIKVVVSANLGVIINKLHKDLEGNSVWLCKKRYYLSNSGFDERSVAEELFDEVKKVDDLPMDSPLTEFRNLDSIIAKITAKLRQSASEVLIYEGVKKLNDKNYIIYFSVRGQGVEAPDHHRINEVLVDISYSEDTGLIKIVITNVESPMGRHEWNVMPSDWEQYFLPSQPTNEILDSIASILRNY